MGSSVNSCIKYSEDLVQLAVLWENVFRIILATYFKLLGTIKMVSKTLRAWEGGMYFILDAALRVRVHRLGTAPILSIQLFYSNLTTI